MRAKVLGLSHPRECQLEWMNGQLQVLRLPHCWFCATYRVSTWDFVLEGLGKLIFRKISMEASWRLSFSSRDHYRLRLVILSSSQPSIIITYVASHFFLSPKLVLYVSRLCHFLSYYHILMLSTRSQRNFLHVISQILSSYELRRIAIYCDLGLSFLQLVFWMWLVTTEIEP